MIFCGTNDSSKSLQASTSRKPVAWTTALLILLTFWIIYGLTPNEPFVLQGAMLEQFVERGRLYFVDGQLQGSALINRETQTEQFKIIPFNMFEYNGRYYVNHSVGQFVLGWPWYRACLFLGLRFSDHYEQVWQILRWTLIAPMGALAVAALFIIATQLGGSRTLGFLTSIVAGLGTPWWATATHYYHDMFGTSLLVTGTAAGLIYSRYSGPRQLALLILSGICMGWSIFTTYLVGPLALLITCIFLFRQQTFVGQMILGVTFLVAAGLLPLTNLFLLGSLMTTGYSRMEVFILYPTPWDLPNLLEKLNFYLFSPGVSLWSLFPGLMLACFWSSPSRPEKDAVASEALSGKTRAIIIALAIAHLLYISSMQAYGFVAWGMGRFFIPEFFLLSLLVPNILTAAQHRFNGLDMLLTALLLQGFMNASIIAAIGLHHVNSPLEQLASQRLGLLPVAAPILSLLLAALIHGALYRRGKKI